MRIACLIMMATMCAMLPATATADAPDHVIFPHVLHFANEVECATCHEAALTSTSASDRLLPEMETCADCHDVEDDDGCADCHTNVDEAGDYTRRTYGADLFSHAAHATNQIECADCHGDPAAAQPALPVKADCRGCHETADDYTDCRLCHAVSQALRPADHRANWRHEHGLCAREDEDSCKLCHTSTACAECHAGDNVRPRSHDLNFAFNHALAARGNEMQCSTCHEDPTYCSSCHITERVLPTDHSQVGWVGASGGRHATEGLFNIESCIACHETGASAPTCARCHGGG